MEETDNSNEKSNWGGVRPGAGRPKGTMNPDTKERLAIKNAFQERVARNADRLFNAQFNLAVGEQFLMWRHKVGSGTKERTVVEAVDNPDIIKAYLDETLELDPDEFYFISTKQANGVAIDSLLDRSFGRSEQKMDLTTDGESLKVVSDPLLVAEFAEFMRNKTKG